MKWFKSAAAILVVLIAAVGLVAAGSTDTGEKSYVKTVSADGSTAEIEFVAPVELVWAASTGSMKPTFGADTLIVSAPDNLQAGDIIVFERGNDLIVHRIVSVESCGPGLCYRTKGDANLFDDGVIQASAVKWEVIGVLY